MLQKLLPDLYNQLAAHLLWGFLREFALLFRVRPRLCVCGPVADHRAGLKPFICVYVSSPRLNVPGLESWHLLLVFSSNSCREHSP